METFPLPTGPEAISRRKLKSEINLPCGLKPRGRILNGIFAKGNIVSCVN